MRCVNLKGQESSLYQISMSLQQHLCENNCPEVSFLVTRLLIFHPRHFVATCVRVLTADSTGTETQPAIPIMQTYANDSIPKVGENGGHID